MKLGVQKHSNRCRVSGGDNFLRRNDIDIPTAGDFFFTAADGGNVCWVHLYTVEFSAQSISIEVVLDLYYHSLAVFFIFLQGLVIW